MLLVQVTSLYAQISLPTLSPRESIAHQIGFTDVTLVYHSPRVQGRTLMGQLIPYNSVWRCGANDNTTIEFSDDVKIEGQDLAAGIYGLHMIPSEDKWIIIFSTNSTSWGSFSYNEAEDALRVEVAMTKAPHQESLRYSFLNHQQNSTDVALNWGEVQVAFKVETDVHEVVLAKIRNDLRHLAGFNRQSWVTAASYCLNNNVNLEEGLTWVNNSINGNFGTPVGFNNYIIKSRILTQLERGEEAKEAEQLALENATVFQLHGYGRQLIGQNQPQRALEVFKLNAKKNPNTWPVNVGLARGYSANGDYKSALKHAKLALNNVPANDNLNKGNLENVIKLLEEGKDIN